MLVSMKPILDKAREGGYGVIAPSVDSEACMAAAVEAAEESCSPVIINIRRAAFSIQDSPLMIQVARHRARIARVPVAINLDHGRKYEDVMDAIHWGYTSVMIDCSAEEFDENVARTAEVVKVAHACGVSVEAELGCVGLADPETMDQFVNFRGDNMTARTVETDPELAKEFVKRTGVDCLAVSIGNKHGPYPKGVKPHIDFRRLAELHEAVPVPLVLHGGSGTGDQNLAKACQRGICKINVGTELRNYAAAAVRNTNADLPCWPFNVTKDAYKEKVLYFMQLFGSAGKA